jgi:hypothetical protein
MKRLSHGFGVHSLVCIRVCRMSSRKFILQTECRAKQELGRELVEVSTRAVCSGLRVDVFVVCNWLVISYTDHNPTFVAPSQRCRFDPFLVWKILVIR